MKNKHITILILIFIFFGCEKSSIKNKIFLDFNLGMNEKDYSKRIDTLKNKGIIHALYLSEEGKKYYYFFDLVENDSIPIQLNKSFNNEYLASLKLDIGIITSSYKVLGGKSYSFSIFNNCEKINHLFSVYSEKYGKPNKFKDNELLPSSLIILGLDSEDDINRNRVYYWDKDNFRIIFYLGKDKYDTENCHDAFIEYELNYDERQKLDENYYENKREIELIKKEDAKEDI